MLKCLILMGYSLHNAQKPAIITSFYDDKLASERSLASERPLFCRYAPELGRWPSRDPIGERGGINLYRFIENNPINLWDRWGLVTTDANTEVKTRDLPPPPNDSPLWEPYAVMWARKYLTEKEGTSDKCCYYRRYYIQKKRTYRREAQAIFRRGGAEQVIVEVLDDIVGTVAGVIGGSGAGFVGGWLTGEAISGLANDGFNYQRTEIATFMDDPIYRVFPMYPDMREVTDIIIIEKGEDCPDLTYWSDWINYE